MIERYHNYNTAKMLADHPENKAALESLKRQYAALDGSSAIRYGEHVKGSRATDGLEKMVIRRADLKAKIDDYERDIAIIDSCIDQLSEDDQAIIREFFWRKQSRTAAVARLEEILHLERSAIYERRAAVLREVTHIIFG